MHTLRFISGDSLYNTNGEHSTFYRSGWIATGCEDGTVRLTRFSYVSELCNMININIEVKF